MKTMELTEVKNFGIPDEVREFPQGRVEVVNIGGATVGRATLQPGWQWSPYAYHYAVTNHAVGGPGHYHASPAAYHR